jgi:hypothetical protein
LPTSKKIVLILSGRIDEGGIRDGRLGDGIVSVAIVMLRE